MSAIQLSTYGGLAELTLNRPEKMNALGRQEWEALGQAVAQALEQGARAIMLRGAGGNFCTGFDIADIRPERTDAFDMINGAVNPALRALRDCPVPTLAAVEGRCMGGGLAIAAACDIIICARSATLGAPYSRIGIMGDGGLHHFLRETLGRHRAAYLLFTAKTLSADEAMQAGLCCELCDDDALADSARALAQALAEGPTTAFTLSKSILNRAQDPDAAMDAEALAQAKVFGTSDAAEGIAAFLERRKPRFTGQ